MVLYLEGIGLLSNYLIDCIIDKRISEDAYTITILDSPWYLYTVDGQGSPYFEEID